MPLQNRVTPGGELAALPGRGTLMGNRGVLHDESQHIVRPWQVRRWITCRLEWRGIRRAVMSPHRYTELFFLDEAAAFAAGHRPCAECRHADYKRFKILWAEFFGAVGADAIDLVLHAERLDGRRKRTWRAPLSALPEGTYVAYDGGYHLLQRGRLWRWSDAGYASSIPARVAGEVAVLTPPSIVRIFSAGYVPAVHFTLA